MTSHWWLNARQQYLQCISNGDMAVLHKAIDTSFMACQITRNKIVVGDLRTKKISKLCITGHLQGNLPVVSGFPSHRTNYVESVSMPCPIMSIALTLLQFLDFSIWCLTTKIKTLNFLINCMIFTYQIFIFIFRFTYPPLQSFHQNAIMHSVYCASSHGCSKGSRLVSYCSLNRAYNLPQVAKHRYVQILKKYYVHICTDLNFFKSICTCMHK